MEDDKIKFIGRVRMDSPKGQVITLPRAVRLAFKTQVGEYYHVELRPVE